MNTEIKERKTYLDILRVAAAIFVITIHVIEQYEDSLAGSQRAIMIAINTLVRSAVPIFVMISGALWLDPSKNVGAKRIARAVARIVSAFVVWSAFYAVVFNAVYMKQNAKSVIAAFFRGQMHLWFLFMMACLYLLIPFLRRIAESRRLVGYFLILSLIFTFILPVVRSVLKGGASDAAEYINQKTYFHFTLGYAPYFLLGRYIASGDFKLRIRCVVYAFGAAAFLASVLSTVFLEPSAAQFKTYYFNAFHPFMLFQSAALFMLAKYAFSKAFGSERSRGALRYLSARMFGVYLVHLFVIKVVCRFTKIALPAIGAALLTPITVAIVFAASLAISALLGLIPLVNKYIV